MPNKNTMLDHDKFINAVIESHNQEEFANKINGPRLKVFQNKS